MKNWQINYQLKEKNLPARQAEIMKAVLDNRQIGSKDKSNFLSPLDPRQLSLKDVGIDNKEMDKAEKRILAAKKKNETVLIWGDYDADGLTAAAILWQALWAKKIKCFPHIPQRRDGYGLNMTVFKQLKKKYPHLGLIITVDNGITALEEVKAIRADGVDVIVTDHHARAKKFPKASAIIWTEQLAGAAVAWFLACRFDKKSAGLDLAGLGTVVDMMPLTGYNRSFAKFGLAAMRNNSRPGLKALFDSAGIKAADLQAYHFGFIIGPRLNAMGRIGKSMESLRLLCVQKVSTARRLAQEIEQTNRRRQAMTKEACEKAEAIIGTVKNKILLADIASLHPGIIGLVAGKLTRKFYRPAVVLCQQEDSWRGSCRSIKGFNIIKALRKMEDLLVGVGGHDQAAGFTVKSENLPKLKEKLTQLAEAEITPALLVRQVEVDCQLNFYDLTFGLEKAIAALAPFGLGNPSPLFYTQGAIISCLRRVGRNNDHLKLVLDDAATPEIEATPADFERSARPLDGIGFSMGQLDLAVGDKIDIAYNLTLNRWRGQKSLQLKIKEIRKSQWKKTRI